MTAPGPARLDLTIYQGDDWILWLAFTHESPAEPFDLSAMTFTAQVRRSSADADDDTGTGPLADAHCVVVDGPGGILTVSFDHDATEGLGHGLNGNQGRWDLQADEDGTITTYLQGLVTVDREVTRS